MVPTHSELLIHWRAGCAFACPLPLLGAIRQEQADVYLTAGLLDSAIAIYDRLEAWDKLATAYRLANRPVQAETVLRERLEGDPTSSRLLCAMGDVTKDEKWYRQAWEVSGQRSARAMRSLGKLLLAK